MKFTKTQIQVLVVLHLVVGVLFAGIFFLPPLIAASPNTPSDTIPGASTHDKSRLPRVSFDGNMYWEANFGGSKDDTVFSAYDYYGATYIIGTTSSTDLDFDENKAISSSNPVATYLMLINQNGSLNFVKFYEGVLNSAFLQKNGTFVIIQKCEGKSFLYNVSLSGETLKAVDLKLDSNETVIDALPDSSNRVNIIISVFQEMPPKTSLKALTMNASLEPSGGEIINHVQDLTYVAAIPHNKGLVIAVNVEGPTSGGMILYNYNNGSSIPENKKYIEIDKIYSALSLISYSNGYAAMIKDNNGRAFILTVDHDTLQRWTITSLNSPVVSACALYTDNSYIYAYLASENGGSSMFKKFDSSLKFLNDVENAFDEVKRVDSFSYYTSMSYFGGDLNGQLSMTVLLPNGEFDTVFQTAFATSSEQIKWIIPFNDYILAICESPAKSKDVGGNFGGKDVWIAKLRFTGKN